MFLLVPTGIRLAMSSWNHNVIQNEAYAVAKGRNPGIYHTWSECQREVKDFEGAVFSGFPSWEEARKWQMKQTGQNHPISKTEQVKPGFYKLPAASGQQIILQNFPKKH